MMMSLFGRNQVNFLVYGRLSKTKGSVGRPNKNNIIRYFLKIFCISNAEEKLAVYNL